MQHTELEKEVQITTKGILLNLKPDDDYPCVYSKVINQCERQMISEVLKFCEGNLTKTAQILSINRGTLRAKMHRHGLYPND